MALINAVDLVKWLFEQKTSLEKDADHYGRAGDKEQALRCDYEAGAYRKIIDHLGRKMNAGS
jgi:hypothetical protein